MFCFKRCVSPFSKLNLVSISKYLVSQSSADIAIATFTHYYKLMTITKVFLFNRASFPDVVASAVTEESLRSDLRPVVFSPHIRQYLRGVSRNL